MYFWVSPYSYMLLYLLDDGVGSLKFSDNEELVSYGIFGYGLIGVCLLTDESLAREIQRRMIPLSG